MYERLASLLTAHPRSLYLINSAMLPDRKQYVDGGIILYVHQDSPGKDKESNCLPAPNGPLSMMLRLYWPKPEALGGTWKQPTLKHVECRAMKQAIINEPPCKETPMKTKFASLFAVACALAISAAAHAQTSNPPSAGRPNILVIWGDDVGMYNISAYHRGLMGGSTPNIDRIAKEGMLFLDHYGQASCTAGRAAFITGQYPIRVGLATVGLPGAVQGMNKKDPTIASLLKPLGYTTGQFGKNHLGDRDEHLPTNNGFDEFFGILYHLNAGEYVEQYDFPERPRPSEETRPARRHPFLGAAGWHPESRGQGAIRPGAATGHRRGNPRGIHPLHQGRREGRKTLFRLAQHHTDALPHQSLLQVGWQKRLRSLCRRHDGTRLRRGRPAQDDR